MKRMLQFEYTDTGYACFEKSEKVHISVGEYHLHGKIEPPCRRK